MSAEAIIITIVITILSAPIAWYIWRKLDQLFKNKSNERIVKDYYEALQEKELERKEEFKEKQQIIDALKRSSISTSRLIERYDKPLNAILISYSWQNPPGFIRDELARYNSKWLGGDVSLIPPKNVPKEIKNRENLKSWFEKEILKDRDCKLKFLALIDLTEKTYWNTYLPDANVERIHCSIGEKLNIDDLFTPEQIRTIALKDIIQNGDIAWLSSRVLSSDELEIIHLNQTVIENKLGNLSLRELSDTDKIEEITSVLTDIGIGNPEEVSKAIVDEAKFWHSRLK